MKWAPIVFAAVVGLLLVSSNPVPIAHGFAIAPSRAALVSAGGASGRADAPTPSTVGGLTVGATVSPSTVCAWLSPTCPSLSDRARVTLTVSAPTTNRSPEQSVQVLFLVETTFFDGACFDAASTNGTCPGRNAYFLSSSNLSLFLGSFLADSGTYASALAAAHPGLNISFGAATFQATGDRFDDADSYAYAAYDGQFVSAAKFPTAVNQSYLFSAVYDVDPTDNMLHGPGISALYAALTGVGIHWTNGSGHVVIVVGSTAPRAPQYPENYCALRTPYQGGCSSPTCEPANSTVLNGTAEVTLRVPACEGWAATNDGNASHSVLALTEASGPCQGTPSGSCLIDIIDVNAVPTNPASRTWMTWVGGGYNASRVANDTHSILAAGCDLARANGGSWAGPVGSNCPGLGTGTISGDVSTSDGRNASVRSLVTAVADAAVQSSWSSRVVAHGGPGPLFLFAMAPGVTGAPSLNVSVHCTTPQGTYLGCPVTPGLGAQGGSPVLSWNWSSSPSQNALYPGDTWSASFDLVVNASPGGSVPLDACTAVGCATVPSGGLSSGVRFVPWTNDSTVTVSFPAATVTAQAPPALAGALRLQLSSVDPGVSVGLTPVVLGGVPPYSASVDFGDGSPRVLDVGPAPLAHVYSIPGAHAVSATFRDALNTTVSATAVVLVSRAMSIVVVAPSSVQVPPGQATFSAVVTGGVAPYAGVWYFGDGRPTLGLVVVHTFVAPGNYTASVTVTDSGGGVVEASVPVGAFGPALPPAPLNASASVVGGGLGGCSPSGTTTASFTLHANASGGVAPYRFLWSFGDGSVPVAGSDQTHVYSATARYSATVTVTDSGGHSAYASVPIEVVLPSCSHPTSAGTPFLPLVAAVGLVALGALAGAFGTLRYLRRRR